MGDGDYNIENSGSSPDGETGAENFKSTPPFNPESKTTKNKAILLPAGSLSGFVESYPEVRKFVTTLHVSGLPQEYESLDWQEILDSKITLTPDAQIKLLESLTQAVEREGTWFDEMYDTVVKKISVKDSNKVEELDSTILELKIRRNLALLIQSSVRAFIIRSGPVLNGTMIDEYYDNLADAVGELQVKSVPQDDVKADYDEMRKKEDLQFDLNQKSLQFLDDLFVFIPKTKFERKNLSGR